MATVRRRRVGEGKWRRKRVDSSEHSVQDSGFELAWREVHSLNDEEKQKLKISVLRYWFLLDYELKETIEKDNISLARVAIERIKFLRKFVDAELLDGALKGDEQSLEDIQSSLLHQGLCEKADKLKISEVLDPIASEKSESEKKDLIDFIWFHRDLVHSYVLNQLSSKDDESINLALRHIHYGSLQRSREEKKKHNEAQDMEAEKSKLDFKKVLLQPAFPKPSKPVNGGTPSSSKGLIPSKSVFVYNLPIEAKVQELWKVLKAWGKILDITLPIKKDKFGRRFGFVLLKSTDEAENFIRNSNGKVIKGNQIKTQFARNMRTRDKKISSPTKVESNGHTGESKLDRGT
ncbi:hypothetical protein DCAR_0311358 [Daucus carota subsp. sativus]|uniref:Uncharacterized protein n=1 Tax=Daucus carota subsp. sativus TaxID=79200 RepID=A0A166AIL8_DAUCS|nr:hypothetical protein DCAR_0311358 [Daucus carota subsp. sativus]